MLLQPRLNYLCYEDENTQLTILLDIVFGFVTALYMLSRRYWSGGIVFLIFSIFYVFCFISWMLVTPSASTLTVH
jgi:hypothetical protein